MPVLLGKWWLVGGAWSGHDAAALQQTLCQQQNPGITSDLLQLAKRQGMNTDIRRSLFVVLVTSEVSTNDFLCTHTRDLY